MENITIFKEGLSTEMAKKVMIMLHGRGGSAQDMFAVASGLHVSDFSLLAPQAKNHTWYPYSFLSPRRKNEPWLSDALASLKMIENDLLEKCFSSEDIYFLGFSQGACLSLEYTARNAKRYGGVIAFTGGLIGEEVRREAYSGSFQGTPVFIGTSDPDAHVPLQRVEETKSVFTVMDANITVKVYENMGHIISREELEAADTLFFANRQE